MSIPRRCATCQSVSPECASTSSPSRINGTLSPLASASAMVGNSPRPPCTLIRAARWFDRDVAAKVLEDLPDGVHGRLPETADRGIGHHRRQVLEQRLIPARLLEQSDGLLGPNPARGTLTAALILEKPQKVQRHCAHVVLIGQDHDSGRSDRAAVLFKGAEIERD